MKHITKDKNVTATQRQTRLTRKNAEKAEDTTKFNLQQFKPKPKKILKRDITSAEKNTPEIINELPARELPVISDNEVKIKTEKPDDESEKNDADQEIKDEILKGKKATKRSRIDVEYDETKIKIEKQTEGVDTIKIKTEMKVETVGSKERIRRVIELPLNWVEMLNNLREMRKNHNAPVDSMGCDQCMEDGANPMDQRYQALLSLMLSSQTKDQVTHAAMQRLIHHGCTLENILNTSDEKLGQLIYPVGFWKTKVKYIKKSSEMIKNQFEGDIPKTVKDLCKLNGVGPKMAHLCMKTAWGEVTGIGVDTHVHRISNRIGWVKSKTPEETRTQLEGWLPKELWSEVNHLLVGFGQQVCLPIKPSCSTCLNCEICPFARKSKIKSEVKVEDVKVKEELGD